MNGNSVPKLTDVMNKIYWKKAFFLNKLQLNILFVLSPTLRTKTRLTSFLGHELWIFSIFVILINIPIWEVKFFDSKNSRIWEWGRLDNEQKINLSTHQVVLSFQLYISLGSLLEFSKLLGEFITELLSQSATRVKSLSLEKQSLCGSHEIPSP